MTPFGVKRTQKATRKNAFKLDQNIDVKEEPVVQEEIEEQKEVVSAPPKSALKKNGQYMAGKTSPSSDTGVGTKRGKTQTLEDLLDESEQVIKLEKGEVEIHPISNMIGFNSNLAKKRVQFNS